MPGYSCRAGGPLEGAFISPGEAGGEAVLEPKPLLWGVKRTPLLMPPGLLAPALFPPMPKEGLLLPGPYAAAMLSPVVPAEP